MERSSFIECHCPDPDSVKRRIDFDLSLGGSATCHAAIPLGASVNRCQEAGGARDWNGERTEFRCANSASVVRYRNSMACGSSNSGGAENTRVLASEMTAQIAQASVDRSVSWLEGCCCAASRATFGAARICA